MREEETYEELSFKLHQISDAEYDLEQEMKYLEGMCQEYEGFFWHMNNFIDQYGDGKDVAFNNMLYDLEESSRKGKWAYIEGYDERMSELKKLRRVLRDQEEEYQTRRQNLD